LAWRPRRFGGGEAFGEVVHEQSVPITLRANTSERLDAVADSIRKLTAELYCEKIEISF
jgi:hypothetical protein